jgi:hypothetical protein
VVLRAPFLTGTLPHVPRATLGGAGGLVGRSGQRRVCGGRPSDSVVDKLVKPQIVARVAAARDGDPALVAVDVDRLPGFDVLVTRVVVMSSNSTSRDGSWVVLVPLDHDEPMSRPPSVLIQIARPRRLCLSDSSERPFSLYRLAAGGRRRRGFYVEYSKDCYPQVRPGVMP